MLWERWWLKILAKLGELPVDVPVNVPVAAEDTAIFRILNDEEAAPVIVLDVIIYANIS
jgi:hypothetical protein